MMKYKGFYSAGNLWDSLGATEKLYIYFRGGIDTTNAEAKAGFITPIRIDVDDRIYKGDALPKILERVSGTKDRIMALIPKNYNNKHTQHIMAVYPIRGGSSYHTSIVYSA
jgi:hypothetical protein